MTFLEKVKQLGAFFWSWIACECSFTSSTLDCTYRRGKRNRACKEYYKEHRREKEKRSKEERLRIECVYKQGKYHGLYLEYYGQKSSKEQKFYSYSRYIQNKKNFIKKEHRFENGIQVGLQREYYPNGLVEREYYIKKSNKPVTIYDAYYDDRKTLLYERELGSEKHKLYHYTRR